MVLFSLLSVAAIIWLLVTAISRINKLDSKVLSLENDILSLKQGLEGAENKTKTTKKEISEPKTVLQPKQDSNSQAQIIDEPIKPSNIAVTDTALADSTPSKAFVFSQENIENLWIWAMENWVIILAAICLAFGGIFMVQYGVEYGVLSPAWRIRFALVFGVALIGVGEKIRRHYGDEDSTSAQYIPSAFSGAGLITLFVTTLAAHSLYGFITAIVAFFGLAAVSTLAVLLGWFYGPLLVSIGVIGASAAPFLLGGGADDIWPFYYYYGFITLTGLLIDTVKRWAWLSSLVLMASYLGAYGIYSFGGDPVHYFVFLVLSTLAAIIIPERRIIPTHSGAWFFSLPILSSKAHPSFPTRLAVVTSLAAFLLIMIVSLNEKDETLNILCLIILWLGSISAIYWLRHAPGLVDLSFILPTLFLAQVVLLNFANNSLVEIFIFSTDSNAIFPLHFVWLIIASIVISVLFYMRSLHAEKPYELYFTLGAASFAPLMVLALEFIWQRPEVINNFYWAINLLGVAGVMTFLAVRTGQAGRDLNAGIYATAAMAMMSMISYIMLDVNALSFGIASQLLFIAILQRRFGLSALNYFIQILIAVILCDTVIYFGFFRAFYYTFPLWDIYVRFCGVLALLLASWLVYDRKRFNKNRLVVESAAMVIAAFFLYIVIFRAIGKGNYYTFWSFGLIATHWLIMLYLQVYLLQKHLGLITLRRLLACLYALLAFYYLENQIAEYSPLGSAAKPIQGPLVFNTLMLAYLPIAAMFGALAMLSSRWHIKLLKLRHEYLTTTLWFLAGAYFATYIGLEIRRFWRGDNLNVASVSDLELYSYTVAMLCGAVGLLFLSIIRRSVLLRKIAMGGMFMIAIKVFFVDISGLVGLLRVASFVGLGLVLIALTWINRKMANLQVWDDKTPKPL